jgi:hypothetical protein
MTNTNEQEEAYSEAETEARREAALKTMFATPHKPHKPIGESSKRPKARPSKSPAE